MTTLGNFFWYGIANSTIEDLKNTILNDKTFLQDLQNGKNTTMHLQKKHLQLVVKIFVNYILRTRKYEVISIKYRFHGMDVFLVSKDRC